MYVTECWEYPLVKRKAVLATIMMSVAACSASAPKVERTFTRHAPTLPGQSESDRPVVLTCVTSGSAVYVGKGSFITASHVIDTQAMREENSPCPLVINGQTRPGPMTVEFGGRTSPAALIYFSPSNTGWFGSSTDYVNGQDLGRFHSDETKAEGAKLCRSNLQLGDRVDVISRLGTTRAQVTAYSDAPEWGAFDVAVEHSVSGGGVFDVKTGCLGGIVSQRWPIRGIATGTLFVTSDKIHAAFPDIPQM